MAPAECPKCEAGVSPSSTVCEHCGYLLATKSPAVPRPAWVYSVFGLYAMIFVALVVAPLVLGLLANDRPADVLIGGTVACVLLGLGYGLAAIPIGKYWYTPPRQRSLALPLIISATCAAALVFAGALASAEYFRIKGDGVLEAAFGAGVVWVVWTLLFLSLSRNVKRETANDHLYGWLIAGSVMELLVAIPMHMVVRRRAECCAGMSTGLAVGVGLIVLILALGPAVLVLFYRRYKQVYARRD